MLACSLTVWLAGPRNGHRARKLREDNNFYLFTGKGSGKFAPKPEPLMAGKNRLKINGAHADPFIVDWDKDGDLDLLSGSSRGGVQWAENTAGASKPPELKEFKTLIEPGPTFHTGQLVSERDLGSPAGSTRVWVADVNDDGKLDLLVGDRITLVSIAKGVSKTAYAEKIEKWKKDRTAALEALNAASAGEEREAAQKRYREVYGQRTEFVNEDPTGYVWLYRRK